MPRINTRAGYSIAGPASSTASGSGVYGWESTATGIKPSGNTSLSTGQAWETTATGIKPSGGTITDDSFWEATATGIKPKST